MKKIVIATTALIAAAAVSAIAYLNRPQARFERHMQKARLQLQQGNLTAAVKEYEKAYDAKGDYTPYASLEVLSLTNRLALQEGRVKEALENSRLYVRNNPQDLKGRVVFAQLAFQAGDVEGAFGAVNEAIEKDPGNMGARLLLAQVRARQGRLDFAEEQLRAAYAAHPDSAAAALPLAGNLLQQRRPQEARKILETLLRKEPQNGNAKMQLVDAYLQEMKPDSARHVLDSWKSEDSSTVLQIDIRKARLLSLLNRLDEAEAALRPHVKKRAENLPVYAELAVIHAKRGRYDSAAAAYAVMGDLQPAARASADMLAFYLQLKNQQPAQALELLKRSSIGEKTAPLLNNQIACYMALNQEDKAMEIVNNQPDSLKPALQRFLADMAPGREFIGEWALANYYQLTGQTYWAVATTQKLHQRFGAQSRLAKIMWAAHQASLGKFAEAAALLEKTPDLTLPQQLTLLELNLRLVRPDKALAIARQIEARSPDIAGIHSLLGNFYLQQGRRDDAVAHYEKELARNPGSVVALNNLAWEYGIVRNDLQKAMPYVERLKKAGRPDARVFDTIGWILAKGGNFDEAVTYLRKAVDLVPDDASALYHLAYAQLKTGKGEEGRQNLDKALATRATFTERGEAEKLRTSF